MYTLDVRELLNYTNLCQESSLVHITGPRMNGGG